MGGRHAQIPCSFCNTRLVRRGRTRCWDCYNAQEGRNGAFEFLYEVTNDGCWEWAKNRDHNGYGTTYHKDLPYLAHRASWVIHRGAIPAGLGVLHRCDNPPCVNPEHLFLGTQADNNRDRDSKGRHAHGERSPHAKLTADNVREILASPESAKALGLRFGVHFTHIHRIRRGAKWAHIQVEVVA